MNIEKYLNWTVIHYNEQLYKEMDNITKYFIREPEREFHVRELAKFVKKSPTTISKYLKNLEKEGILISRIKLNHLLFKANTESYIFKDLKTHYNIESLRKSRLIEYLIEKFNNPEAIILFGSFCKGEDIQKSDIDLLIITPLKKEINLIKFEKILEHDIQLFLYSHEEIEKLKIKNKELLNSFINSKVLYGFLEVFR